VHPRQNPGYAYAGKGRGGERGKGREGNERRKGRGNRETCHTNPSLLLVPLYSSFRPAPSPISLPSLPFSSSSSFSSTSSSLFFIVVVLLVLRYVAGDNDVVFWTGTGRILSLTSGAVHSRSGAFVPVASLAAMCVELLVSFARCRPRTF